MDDGTNIQRKGQVAVGSVTALRKQTGSVPLRLGSVSPGSGSCEWRPHVEERGFASPYLKIFLEIIQRAGTCPPGPGTQWSGVHLLLGNPKVGRGCLAKQPLALTFFPQQPLRGESLWEPGVGLGGP